MIYNIMNTNALAFTLRKTRNPITLDDYLNMLDQLSQHVDIFNVNFETTKGLHCHAYIETDKFVDFKALLPPRGWNFKVVPIYNAEGWRLYSEKDRRYRMDFQTREDLTSELNKGDREEIYDFEPNPISDLESLYDGVSTLIKRIGKRRL